MGKKKKACYSGIGGQAVLEGIMMKNNDKYAVAVRKPSGEIEVEVDAYHGVIHGSAIKKIPFIRGIFNFLDSLILGMKCLNFSASFYEEEEEKETKTDKVMHRVFKDKTDKIVMGITTVISFVLAIAIFVLLPMGISSLLNWFVRSEMLEAVLEGVFRLLIFLAYIVAISAMKDIRRVYQYHGAEHKCINCIEHGRELNKRNVMRSSRYHRRCGTSFLLFVIVISIILFFFIRVDNIWLKMLYRILLIPIIAGISYEIIRLAGRFDNVFTRILSAPGMWLQKLTTREPDRDMVEVAIAAVEAVYDWKTYLKENFGYDDSEDILEAEDSELSEGHEMPEDAHFLDVTDLDDTEN